MYVNSIRMVNVRCFEDATIELLHPDQPTTADVTLPNVNLLLGNNGAGKSTTLRAIALGVLARVLKEVGYTPYRMVRTTGRRKRSYSPATIHSELVLGRNESPPKGQSKDKPYQFELTIERVGDYETLGKQEGAYLPDLFEDESPAFFMVGYGSTRRVADAEYNRSDSLRERRERLQRVWGLFRDSVALTPLNSWLPHVKSPTRTREIQSLLNALLPDEIRFKGKLEGASGSRSKATMNREYLFQHNGTEVVFPALSDGYRAYVAWIADLVYHMYTCTPSGQKLKQTEGLVLVDEIDLHLHPQWQLQVLETISKALPRIQFVCSTHSPIVAGTLRREQVFVMEPVEQASQIRKYGERLHGLNADQILTSSYFGLTSTRAVEFENELESLRKRAMNGDSKASVEILRRLAGRTKQEAVEGLENVEA